MKIKYLFLALFATVLFTSCEKEENETNLSLYPLEGGWTLTEASGGMTGEDHQFEEGEIIFNFGKGDVEIVNNLPENHEFGIFASGTYSYKVESFQGGFLLLYIEGEVIGTLDASNEELIIDNREADGYRFVLNKHNLANPS